MPELIRGRVRTGAVGSGWLGMGPFEQGPLGLLAGLRAAAPEGRILEGAPARGGVDFVGRKDAGPRHNATSAGTGWCPGAAPSARPSTSPTRAGRTPRTRCRATSTSGRWPGGTPTRRPRRRAARLSTRATSRTSSASGRSPSRRDRANREIRIKGDGLLGQALQHEVDHLDGVLLIDRLASLDQLRRVEPDTPVGSARDRSRCRQRQSVGGSPSASRRAPSSVA
jgi:hypothetical protein